nr:hypothetical protein CFP56_09695 [Quercus suber]
MSLLPNIKSRHRTMAVEHDHPHSFTVTAYRPENAAIVAGRASSLGKPSAVKWTPSKIAEQPESSTDRSRDLSTKRPPSLAATHPYKYLDPSPTELDGILGKQVNMPGRGSIKDEWAPITPESLPDDSMSLSPALPAKSRFSPMGPPPVPRRHKLATQAVSPNPYSSKTNVRACPAVSPSCSSTRCFPHTHLLDPMMQHSNSPTLWLYDANVDRRDTDLTNGNVTSPLAMVGLPLGGMIEMANYYPPDSGHRWDSAASRR